MTNRDILNSMNNELLSSFIMGWEIICDGEGKKRSNTCLGFGVCEPCFLTWLEEDVEEIIFQTLAVVHNAVKLTNYKGYFFELRFENNEFFGIVTNTDKEIKFYASKNKTFYDTFKETIDEFERRSQNRNNVITW